MRIKLLPPQAKQIARDILSGDLPPETSNLEVLEQLCLLDPSLEAYQESTVEVFNGEYLEPSVNITEFTHQEIKDYLQKGVDIRPQ